MTKATMRKSGGAKKFFEEYGMAYLMILPSLVMFVLLIVYPLGWVISNMFFDTDGVSYKTYVGLENFARMMHDELWWNSVGNTFELAAKLLVLQLPMAVILAAILNNKVVGKNFFRVVYYLPAVTSAAVMSLVFSFMFSPYNGVINQILQKIGLPAVNWLDSANGAMSACVLFSLWVTFGNNMLLVLSGLQGIPNDVYESASLDGASEVRQFFSITIPMLMPVLRTVFMLALIGALQIMDTVLVMTNGGPDHATEVMPLYIYNQFFAGSTLPAYGYGAALGVSASVIIGIITIVYNIMSKKMDEVM